MSDSLQTLRKQVEKETVHGLSWDTAVQLLVIQGLTEVSSQVAQLNRGLVELRPLLGQVEDLSRVLAEILAESKNDARVPDFSSSDYTQDGTPPASTPERTGGVTAGVREPKQRGRPRKGSRD